MPKVFGIDKDKFVKVAKISEPDNILDRYGITPFESGSMGGIWTAYTQTNCQVSI